MWEKNTLGGVNLTAGKICEEIRKEGVHDMAHERELILLKGDRVGQVVFILLFPRGRG